jgi:hypothetical protein
MFPQNLAACPECDMLQRISVLSPDESGTNNSLGTGQGCTDCRQST